MFMQNIRRATKKHRKVLLAVVLLLMLGLVGSFATWNSRSGVGGGSDAGAGEFTLVQQINSYLEYIRSLEAEAREYSDFITLASSYMELGYLYANNLYNGTEEEKATAQDAVDASAGWAREYYQRALDNAPEGLNSKAIADIKAAQAEACEMQGDWDSAAFYRNEAAGLSVADVLSNISSLEAEAGDYDGYLAVAAAYMDLSSLYAEILNNGYEEDNSSTQKSLSVSAAMAREYYQRALDNPPEIFSDTIMAEIKAAQAQACYIESDMEGALTYMEEAHDLIPDEVNFITSIAMLHQEMEHNTEAVMFYQQARNMAPEDPYIVDAYANFLLTFMGTERAIREWEIYRDALPEDHPYKETADDYIVNLQSWADFMASFEQAIEEEDYDPEIDF